MIQLYAVHNFEKIEEEDLFDSEIIEANNLLGTDLANLYILREIVEDTKTEYDAIFQSIESDDFFIRSKVFLEQIELHGKYTQVINKPILKTQAEILWDLHEEKEGSTWNQDNKRVRLRNAYRIIKQKLLWYISFNPKFVFDSPSVILKAASEIEVFLNKVEEQGNLMSIILRKFLGINNLALGYCSETSEMIDASVSNIYQFIDLEGKTKGNLLNSDYEDFLNHTTSKIRPSIFLIEQHCDIPQWCDFYNLLWNINNLHDDNIDLFLNSIENIRMDLEEQKKQLLSLNYDNSPRIVELYADEDKKAMKHFKKHLNDLRNTHHLRIWNEDDIQMGTNREKQTLQHIKNSDIIICYISIHFFLNKEIQNWLQHSNLVGKTIFPLIIGWGDWKDKKLNKNTKKLSNYNPFPNKGILKPKQVPKAIFKLKELLRIK